MVQNQQGDLGHQGEADYSAAWSAWDESSLRVWLLVCKSLTHQGHGVLLLHACFSTIFSLGSLTFEMFRVYFTEVTAWENCHAAKEENP